MDTSVGKEIIRQMGGSAALIMLGSLTKNSKPKKGFEFTSHGVILPIGQNHKGVNRLEVKLNFNDFYDVRVYKLSAGKETKIESRTDVFCGDLRATITELTGLYTKLF